MKVCFFSSFLRSLGSSNSNLPIRQIISIQSVAGSVVHKCCSNSIQKAKRTENKNNIGWRSHSSWPFLTSNSHNTKHTNPIQHITIYIIPIQHWALGYIAVCQAMRNGMCCSWFVFKWSKKKKVLQREKISFSWSVWRLESVNLSEKRDQIDYNQKYPADLMWHR